MIIKLIVIKCLYIQGMIYTKLLVKTLRKIWRTGREQELETNTVYYTIITIFSETRES